MKRLKLFSIFICLFFLIERLCRLQTDGFSIAKILPHNQLEHSEIQLPRELYETLNQPYYFLGSGVQCYAFLSEDKQNVLKFFKHYHLFPGNNVAKLIPFPFQKTLIQKREKRLHKIFKSCQIAYDNLQEETGILLTHFHHTACPVVTIVDRLRIAHALDLSGIEFVLQKSGIPILSKIKDTDSLEQTCDKLKKLNQSITQKGFKTKDTKIRNYAFSGETLFIIDIGSLAHLKNRSQTLIEKREKKFDQKLASWRENIEKTL